MLGRALREVLGPDAIFTDEADCDVTDPGQVDAALDGFRPDVVVHAAAWTDVDACEADPVRARRVNAEGAGTVARSAARRGIGLLAISTDYVFAGDLGRPVTEDDPPGPLSVYGLSKLEGERAVRAAHPAALILRTCGLYGPGGRHFPQAIARRIEAGQALRVVDDQVVSPTYTRDLARAIAALLERPAASGVLHAANAGAVTWFEVAREIALLLGRPGHPLTPIPSSGLRRPAPRPECSALDCTRLGREHGIVLRSWREALRAFHEDERGRIT